MLRPAGNRARQFRRLANDAGRTRSEPVQDAPEWLPPLRWQNRQWWLPLDRSTALGFSNILLRVADDDFPSARRSAIDVLAFSPVGMIWSVLSYHLESGSKVPQSLPLEVIVDWICQRLSERCQEGSLAAPRVMPELLTSWDHCQAKCATLTREAWMSTAGDWLELTGEKVPKNWRSTWPSINTAHLPTDWPVDRSIVTRFEPSQLSLRSLADRCYDSIDLRERFSTAVGQAKRESVYQLAYGLSHMLNNPLANISARAQWLLSEEVDQRRARSMQSIVDQSRRAHRMIVDLMFIARPPQPTFESVEMPNFLQSIIDEYRSRSLEKISLRRVPASPDAMLADSEERWMIDRRLLGDALRALIDNAVAACGDGGEIVVTWGRKDEHGTIAVSDNGPGLSAKDQVHAFDPYYAGPESGRGLGMGLAKVDCIAKLHGGEASLEDRHPGCRATIRLKLADEG